MKIFYWLFTKIVCPQIQVKFSNNGWEYDHIEETIYIDPKDTKDCGFLRHLKKVHGYKNNYSLMVWSVLHEIGHYHTLDYCEIDEFTRALIGLISPEEAEKSEKIQDAYFNLEEEWEATEWAIEYAKNHKMLCALFTVLLR